MAQAVMRLVPPSPWMSHSLYIGILSLMTVPAHTNYLSGSGESGKSTIVKQMKIIHQNGFTKEELLTYRPIIYKNVLDSAQAIVNQMRKLGVDCVLPANRVCSRPLPQCRVPLQRVFS
jgi:hypothetical protein